MKTTEYTSEQQGASEPESARRISSDARDETTIPVVQEELDVRTRRVEIDSGVRVSKTVEEREELVDEPLERDEVEVERVSINRPIESPISVRYEGDTMIIPILEEMLVIEKRLILKEEIRVTRRKTEFRDPQRVTLRRELADVARIEDGMPNTRAGERDGSRPPTDAESLLDHKRREQEELRRTLGSPPTRER